MHNTAADLYIVEPLDVLHQMVGVLNGYVLGIRREGEGKYQGRQLANARPCLLKARQLLTATVDGYLVALAYLAVLVSVREMNAHPSPTHHRLDGVACLACKESKNNHMR